MVAQQKHAGATSQSIVANQIKKYNTNIQAYKEPVQMSVHLQVQMYVCIFYTYKFRSAGAEAGARLYLTDGVTMSK